MKLSLAGFWIIPVQALALMFTLALATPVPGQEDSLGQTLEGLLEYAKAKNPDYAAMQSEAEAAAERVMPAGALPDPRLRTQLLNVTSFGRTDLAPLFPTRTDGIRYLLMQDLPWLGKRDLKRDIAQLDADGAKANAVQTWAELASRIKATQAQRYYLLRTEQLTHEILDLMTRLEKIAQVRYAGGLAAQQDVIRAQVEQTGMKSELVALESEKRQLNARLNGLLARPASAALAEPAQFRLSSPPAKLDYAVLEDRLRSRNPLLFAGESRIRASEKNRDLAYKNRYPDFIVGVSPVQIQGAIRDWELMFELNIPLQQSTRRAQERESEAMLSSARLRKEAIANQLLAELSEHLAGIEAAQQLEQLATTRLLPQAELTSRAALAGYETGKVDFATLLDAQRQIRQAKQNQIKAQVEAQVRLADIERLIGEDL